MNIKQINWENTEWKTVRQGIERKAFGGDGATIALHRLWPGHEVLPHSHENEQIAYIIEGSVDFRLGDQVIRLGPGGIVVVPPNVIHCATVVGDEPVLNLDVFTPARPEYET
ncbi:cupin [Pollutimonas subterranea]|uniref:Cupin n=1 Tax=Pollutimonas subterranea TaxID=2045210 RepID=A0A2N4U710_9BURK|nr:cupin domain-containing protein [Pollutimonas subterranea]PLC50779.1 cupin [Pollutimonas subterranea]